MRMVKIDMADVTRRNFEFRLGLVVSDQTSCTILVSCISHVKISSQITTCFKVLYLDLRPKFSGFIRVRLQTEQRDISYTKQRPSLGFHSSLQVSQISPAILHLRTAMCLARLHMKLNFHVASASKPFSRLLTSSR